MERDRPKHRFFAAELTGADIALAGGEAHHALHVLRLKAGHPVELFDGRGRRVLGTLARADRKGVVVAVDRFEGPDPRPGPDLHVAFAAPKGKRLDWILEKLTELGARDLTPLNCERSVVAVRADGGAPERWTSICIAAARQSGQSYIPTVHEPTTMEQFCRERPDGTRLLACGAAGDGATIGEALAACHVEPIHIAIGPEGGWSESEIAAAEAAAFAPAALGHTTLRTETAAVAVAAAVIGCWPLVASRTLADGQQ